ncbi:MAG: LamG-like jellyroll fold domain-containing protein [Planctomycetota bacterium]
MYWPLPLILLVSLPFSSRHDGPDPIGSWQLTEAQISAGVLEPILGTRGRVEGKVKFVGEGVNQALWFDGRTTRIVLADNIAESQQKLPLRNMTVEAWVAVNERSRWGGIIGSLQDNGPSEKGWLLGHSNGHFTFGISTKGADDGDGKMTYLSADSRFELGRMYHVVGTYDGTFQRVYVNGKLEAESQVQFGDLLYPNSAPLIIGGYQDDDESYYFKGRIRSVRIFDQTAKETWVKGAFRHFAELADAKAMAHGPEDLSWVIHPYLQWATRDGMTLRWESSHPTRAKVCFGTKVLFQGKGDQRKAVFEAEKSVSLASTLGEIRLNSLKANTAYYYQIELADKRGQKVTSPVLSFQTAPERDTPFAFAVISDTQTQPKIATKIAQHAWDLRPNFVLHPGDLVDAGKVKQQWEQEFFSSMKPLLERVALFPVLGNHEQDARFYYDYMSLPDPEYYYTFHYGNTQFFMLDSNRAVGPETAQYKFLERALRASKAKWKIVCYHHPAYTSDENDYGNTWYGPSTKGDLRVRALVPLFDRYGVDIVWNGHIHSYERTWPLKKGRATMAAKGTVYMVTGGGGGPLERAGPIRPFFQNTVRHGHHFCFVAVNGGTLEMKAYDLEGRLFDSLKIEKGK